MYELSNLEETEYILKIMLHYLTPDYVFDNIYEITPDFLISKGIKGALIDIDGTVASHRVENPSQQLCKYIKSLENCGIKVIFLSNNNYKRVGIFSSQVGIKSISKAKKPLKKGFKNGSELLNIPLKNIVVIGDQIFTDVFGGNLTGALTCKVQSIDIEEFWIKLRYQFERYFVKRALKKMQEDKKNGN